MSRTIRNKNMAYYGAHCSKEHFLNIEERLEAHRIHVYEAMTGRPFTYSSESKYQMVPTERQFHRFHSSYIWGYGPSKWFRNHNQRKDRAYKRKECHKALFAVEVDDIDFYNRCYKKHAGYWD